MKHMTLFSLCHSHTLKACRTTVVCAASIALSLTVAGCSNDQPEETFPAPSYSYLPTLYLNVGHISIDNHVTFDKHDLAAQSPTSPTENLQLMAQQRLKTTGNSGEAHFTITQAQISKASHHQLNGTFSAQLTLDDPMTQHHGRITATVHQQRSFPSDTSRQRNLYTLNQALMDDMNVELEYQVRKHLSDWLTDATGTPLNATVHAQDLTPTQQNTLSSSPLASPSEQNHSLAPSGIPSSPVLQHATHPGELRLPQ